MLLLPACDFLSEPQLDNFLAILLLVQVRQHIQLRFDLKTPIFWMLFHNAPVLVSVELHVHSYTGQNIGTHCTIFCCFHTDKSQYSGSDCNFLCSLIHNFMMKVALLLQLVLIPALLSLFNSKPVHRACSQSWTVKESFSTPFHNKCFQMSFIYGTPDKLSQQNSVNLSYEVFHLVFCC